MNKEELSQIATVQDLEKLRLKIMDEFRQIVQENRNPRQEFYSPKEFQRLTGIPYSTVIRKCTTGNLKARQEEAKGSWLIHASELDRYKKEAEENL